MNRRSLLGDLLIAAVLAVVGVGLLYVRERIADYRNGLPQPQVREVARVQQPTSELIGRWELSSDNVTFFHTLEIRPDGVYRFLDRRGNVVRAGKYFINADQYIIFQAQETLPEQYIKADVIYNHELEYVVSSPPRQLALFLNETAANGQQIQEVWKFVGKDVVDNR